MLATERLSICAVAQAWQRWFIEDAKMRFGLFLDRLEVAQEQNAHLLRATFLLPTDRLSDSEKENLRAVKSGLLARRMKPV